MPAKTVKAFLTKYADLMDSDPPQWEEFYKIGKNSIPYIIGEVSQALLKHMINPLDDLDYVPARFLSYSTDIRYLEVPDNIKRIEEGAFLASDLKDVIL